VAWSLKALVRIGDSGACEVCGERTNLIDEDRVARVCGHRCQDALWDAGHAQGVLETLVDFHILCARQSLN
jgi:hypothetical protein